MKRRDFIKISGAASAIVASGIPLYSQPSLQSITASNIPRWRGFNLLEMFTEHGNSPFREEDFEIMVDLGFDFARIPMTYWNWSKPDNWMEIDEDELKRIDDVVELGKQYNVHINLNLHRLPGYCVNRADMEPHLLFGEDKSGRQKALEAAKYHWRMLARRYKGIPNRELSFDLLNEPPFSDSEAIYVEVAKALVAVIREEDPERLIVADGLDLGQTPVMGLADVGLVQSTRGYLPKAVSHYTATWVPENEFETKEIPIWPLLDDKGNTWDKEKLRGEFIEKWKPLTEKGVKVHVGEWGVYKNTPHDVTLAWMEDVLSLWKEADWGQALWNLRGDFGILDSGRKDVVYENYKGHKLDRKMLELLRKY
ncbi:cellulase family glycosylhydrolase [Flammeovirgaceae bacterium SG7u.111]|nr:cellulase family glycosylhydrolase [Flammeovirgaceae bacterium SG7u.132]WPO36385.1 cellulase family glycosylhydrolase [Flammeovirgaceae bacterium SG7u.111]